jgi:hypothetical protein
MDDPWATILALAEDRSSGAGEIARRAASALSRVPPKRVREGVQVLIRGHPSMAPLWRLGTEALGASHGYREAMHRYLRILDRDAMASEVMAGALPSRIVTISWSSAVAEAVRRRRPELVVCMASEPGGEGKLTAEALHQAAGSVEVWDDGEAIAQVPGQAVVAGADAVTPAGIINKIGTTALADAARRKGVPCYAVAGETKLVADGLPLRAPFESTPLELFTAVAMPEGLLAPDRVGRLARSHPVHPDLVPLLQELGGRPSRGSAATRDPTPPPPDPS